MHSTIVNAIEISHLRRIFKSNIGVIKRTTKEIVAVDDVSFEIQEGELFGLLGPNGAGKTTTVNVMFINNFVYFLLLIFSGANVRLDQVPAWVQTTSSLLPLTRGISAARLLVQGASLAEVMPLLLGELAVGLVYSLLGYFLFAIFEVEAKKRGTLEVF